MKNSAKKIMAMFVSILLVLSFTVGSFAYEDVALKSKTGLILSIDDGQLLYGKNIKAKYKIASITKLMTALVVSEKMDLNGKIVSKKDYNYIFTKYVGPQSLRTSAGSFRAIYKGEIFSTRELFNVMLVYSPNDVAILFADTVAGSETKFVELMNQKAKSIGMKNTHFTNASGLSSAGEEINQYTTMEDMSILIKEVYKNKDILAAVKRKTTYLKSNYRSGEYKNTNALLISDSRIFGLKTGTTDLAGSCLSTLINIKGRIFAAITAGAIARPNAIADHQFLFKKVENYKPQLSLVPTTEKTNQTTKQETEKGNLETSVSNSPGKEERNTMDTSIQANDSTEHVQSNEESDINSSIESSLPTEITIPTSESGESETINQNTTSEIN